MSVAIVGVVIHLIALVNLVLWNLVVRVGVVVRVDHDLWLSSTLAVLAIDTINLFVERWRSVLN